MLNVLSMDIWGEVKCSNNGSMCGGGGGLVKVSGSIYSGSNIP